MISGQKFSKTTSPIRLSAIALIGLLAGCSTTSGLDYPEANYREVIYQVTYDLLRAAECRQIEAQQAYRSCDHSYFRDYEHYRRVRSDFMDSSLTSKDRPF